MSFQDHLNEVQNRKNPENTVKGSSGSGQVADASTHNWVDQYAPEFAKPYLRLMRADRPIGIWLLLWPCWWSAALASLAAGHAFPNPWHLALFVIGATVMRGAGCTYNDIVDRDIDAKVARTRSRPIPSGSVSVKNAAGFMIALCLVGFIVLLQFNMFSIFLGVASIAPVAIYPFMKRFMSWPQLVLGLTFSWGAFIGWSALHGSLELAPFLLYFASVAWTIGYDTIYAHQDKEDDALLGLGSTALTFSKSTGNWLIGLYATSSLLILGAGLAAGGGIIFALGALLGAGHLAWQIRTLNIDDPQNCLSRFRSNRDYGAIIFGAILADMIAKAI